MGLGLLNVISVVDNGDNTLHLCLACVGASIQILLLSPMVIRDVGIFIKSFLIRSRGLVVWI